MTLQEWKTADERIDELEEEIREAMKDLRAAYQARELQDPGRVLEEFLLLLVGD